jgi:hypothetical protein
VRSRLVSARELQKVIADGGIREPLRPDYQPEHFEWLLKQADGGKEGLRAAVVENASTGSSCGWWVYLQENDAAATLFHIGARRRDQFGAVFDSLLYDAWEQGMALLRGPAIPAALPTLSQKGCLFRQMSTRTLFHTRDPKIELALLRGEAALSWLDSESWLHFARRSWT